MTTDLGTVEVAVSVFALNGRRPYDVIQDYITGCTTALQQLKDNQMTAIENFMTRMAFKNSDEAQPKLLSAMFKKVFDKATDELLDGMGDVGLPLANLKAVIDGATDEMQRAQDAEAEFTLANYLNDMRTSVTDGFRTRIMDISKSGPSLDSQFDQLGTADDKYKDGDVGVTGAQGDFLKGLDANTQRLQTQATNQTVNKAETDLMENWVTGPGAVGLTDVNWLTGSIGNGQILVRFDSDDNVDSTKLYVSAKSGNAADMVTEVMQKGSLKIWELGIPVVVSMWGPGFNLGSSTDAYQTTLSGPPSAGVVPSGGPSPDDIKDRWAKIVSDGKIDQINKVTGG